MLCFFAQYLKDKRDFQDAMGAAHVVDHPEQEPEDRDTSKDNSRSALLIAQGRLDILGLLLHRRQFHADRVHDMIDAITLYSDSSPTSGSEMQGMLCDVFRKGGGFERITLPGSTLQYGQCDAVSKTIALVWAVWLLVGPHIEELAYLFNKVVGVTTDFGVEVFTLMVPNILRAFVAWVSGTPLQQCMGLVDFENRLLPFAIRLSGFGHSMGNIMKKVGECITPWPRWLEALRHACAFWRNETWRNWARTAMRQGGVSEDIVKLVPTHFTANLAKWRYEAMPVVLTALDELRPVCEGPMRREWYANSQERAMMTQFFDACEDKALWILIRCSNREVYSKAEEQRRWGMTCGCPEHVQARLEHKSYPMCWKAGRRLEDAWPTIKLNCTEWDARADAMTIEECEGDEQVWRYVRTMVQQLAVMTRHRNKYLGTPPWSFALVLTVDGAKRFMRHLRSRPPQDHDPVTRRLGDLCGAYVDAVAEGGEPHPDLKEAHRRFCLATLNEGPGEGYHRGTTYEQKRAGGSTSAHLKQSNREQAVYAQVKRFRRRFGQRGQDVLKFEWVRYKRVLQTNLKRPWRPVDMRTKPFFRRVYREDELAEANWNSIVTKKGMERPAVPEVDPDSATALQHEYVLAAVEVGAHYSLEVATEGPVGEHGELAPHTEMLHIEVLKVAHAKAREHIMPTVFSADDESLVAPVAFLVHHLARLPEDVAGPGGGDSVHLFKDSEPVWVRPFALAPCVAWSGKLFSYDRATPSNQSGCIVLSDRRRAVPRHNLLDPKCPTLVITAYLRKQGWTSAAHAVTHETLAIADFDGVEAIKRKFYYQAVVALSRCLPLTSCLPSREPQNYYKLLLRGLKAEPGEPAKTYQAILDSDSVKKGRAPEPLAVEDKPGEDSGGDSDGVKCPQPLRDRSPDKPKGPRGPANARRALASRARGSGDPPPVEPPIGGDPGGDGGGGSGGPGLAPLPPPTGEAEESDEDHVKSCVVAPRPKPVADRKEKVPNEWVDALDGAKVHYRDYLKPNGKRYRNVTLACPCHRPCEKTRGYNPHNTAAHGDLEPLAAVHAWIHLPLRDGCIRHSQVDPTPEEITAYLDSHRADLQALSDRLMG